MIMNVSVQFDNKMRATFECYHLVFPVLRAKVYVQHTSMPKPSIYLSHFHFFLSSSLFFFYFEGSTYFLPLRDTFLLIFLQCVLQWVGLLSFHIFLAHSLARSLLPFTIPFSSQTTVEIIHRLESVQNIYVAQTTAIFLYILSTVIPSPPCSSSSSSSSSRH